MRAARLLGFTPRNGAAKASVMWAARSWSGVRVVLRARGDAGMGRRALSSSASKILQSADEAVADIFDGAKVSGIKW